MKSILTRKQRNKSVKSCAAFRSWFLLYFYQFQMQFRALGFLSETDFSLAYRWAFSPLLTLQKNRRNERPRAVLVGSLAAPLGFSNIATKCITSFYVWSLPEAHICSSYQPMIQKSEKGTFWIMNKPLHCQLAAMIFGLYNMDERMTCPNIPLICWTEISTAKNITSPYKSNTIINFCNALQFVQLAPAKVSGLVFPAPSNPASKQTLKNAAVPT